MRLNKYIALASGLSRRAADAAVAEGRVVVNGHEPSIGQNIQENDVVQMDGENLRLPRHTTTIIFNKPRGVVVSRDGQGSSTIYELLPPSMQNLKAVGRLDKYSSGLLLLTNDGDLANQLTHPRFAKTKVYEIKINKALQPDHQQMISQQGVTLEDGPSKFTLEKIRDNDELFWKVTMQEGRNRQIRRTFEALGYAVTGLHRTQFGPYTLAGITSGHFRATS